MERRVSIKRIYQSYTTFLELHYYQVNFLLFSSLAFLFLELNLSLQVLEYHILVLVRLFLKIHVISERL